jgi:hypothetical protein
MGAMSAAETEADAVGVDRVVVSASPAEAERVESLVSQEHAAWVSQPEDAARHVGNSQ